MAQESESAIQKPPVRPTARSCYAHGWRQMWKYVLELLLITGVSILLSLPYAFLKDDQGGQSILDNITVNILFVEIGGPAAAAIFSLVFVILFNWPLEYGIAYAFLRAARGKTVKVKDMFRSFQNYWNAVLANILTLTIVGAGMVLFIIPGIYFGCKLAFVPYLVVEEKMEVVDAVKESWRLTRGHAFTVFLIGAVAILVAIGGLILVGVGIIFSIIWIRLASASLYYAVSLRESPA
ncbi:MAG: glycerophosphoryl diester phosphodiesterase membrane domain-containing protein [Bacteroidota bacterium]